MQSRRDITNIIKCSMPIVGARLECFSAKIVKGQHELEFVESFSTESNPMIKQPKIFLYSQYKPIFK